MPFLEGDPGPLAKSWTRGPTESPLKGRKKGNVTSVNQGPKKTGLRLPQVGRRRGMHLTFPGISMGFHVGGARVPCAGSFVSWGGPIALL